MRQINKGTEPILLTQARAALVATPGVTDYYASLDAATRGAIIGQAICEQGHLCAYTNLRISSVTCHIEHMYPQSPNCPGQVTNPLTAIDYTNMVACTPAPNTGTLPYGAHPKANWPCPADRHLFVRPTDPGVESRFTYAWDGGIAATNPADQAAQETIKKLCLDHPELKLLRRRTLEPFHSMTDFKKLKKRLGDAKRRGDHDEEFCVAKEQVISKRLHALQQRRKAISGRRRP